MGKQHPGPQRLHIEELARVPSAEAEETVPALAPEEELSLEDLEYEEEDEELEGEIEGEATPSEEGIKKADGK